MNVQVLSLISITAVLFDFFLPVIGSVNLSRSVFFIGDSITYAYKGKFAIFSKNRDLDIRTFFLIDFLSKNGF